MINGYHRDRGIYGIRNKLLILYTVNCSAFIARSIKERLCIAGLNVDVAGNESCYDNQSMVNQLLRLCIHPNVGAVLVVGHGCEFIQAEKIAGFAISRGRAAKTVFGQQLGTHGAIEKGVEMGRDLYRRLSEIQAEECGLAGMVIGLSVSAWDETVLDCLGSMEAVLTHLMDRGAAVLLAEHYLRGLRPDRMRERAVMPHPELLRLQKKVEHCFGRQHKFEGSEEERASLEAYILNHIAGCVKLSQVPKGPGLWFSDSLPDYGTMRGPLNGGITGELMQYTGNGSVLNLTITGKGTAVGSAAAPALIITGNRDTWEKMPGDLDLLVDPKQDMQDRILDLIRRTMSGSLTASERNGQCDALLFQNAQETG